MERGDDEITDIWRRLSKKERKPIDDRRMKYRGVNDETALTAARALLEEVKALYIKGEEVRAQ